jgi:serine phosphatase RsbU (regulator of sigma subunit)
MESIAFSLFKIGLAPFLLTVILFAAFRSGRFSALSNKRKQIIAGILFGLMAVYATERGVPFEGAIINVRDASPICAGLFFGAPAGLIAGTIGAVERWFCVLWGGGYYTRVACSFSTFFAGASAAFARRYFSDNKVAGVSQSTILAFTVEVVHMLMIFLTNLNDVKRAFLYVEVCTGPMVALNTLVVAVSALMIYLMEIYSEGTVRSKLPTISAKLQQRLILVVFAGFLLTQAFNYSLQRNIADEDTRSILYLNLEDAAGDLEAETRRSLYSEAWHISVDLNEEISQEDLVDLMTRHGLSEINLVGKDGIIFQSSNQEYVGFDMMGTELSSEFMKLLDTSSRFIQDLRNDCYNDKPCKFAGVRTDYGFLEIGLSLKQYHSLIREGVISVSDNRHVGETGTIVVIDEFGSLLSENIQSQVAVNQLLRDVHFIDLEEMSVYSHNSSSLDVYYMFKNVEGFRVLAVYPKSEADFSRRVSIYLTSFMETIVFAMIFSAIFATIRNSVVSGIIEVKESLNNIVEGDLDTVVNVRSSKEFDELSDDINLTVNKLKELIADAKERIDTELRYARQIQRAALPSVFPPYPKRDEFDIYALMKPARQIGGDFYDFYLLENDVLAFLVADVSGKGIPASLFMMRSKTTIKNMAEKGVSVAEIFTAANDQLCEGNTENMFVTCWMGFLDLRTGVLKFANAGHNPPLLKRKDGHFEYLKMPAGFVLAGMEDIVYKEQEIILEPGDEIFLYTDGVVEATNVNKELYGEDRLLEFIDHEREVDAKAVCEDVLVNVFEFFKGADQFDDITELSLKYLKKTD